MSATDLPKPEAPARTPAPAREDAVVAAPDAVDALPPMVDENGVHIIDQMILDRAEGLRTLPFWPPMKAVLYPTLGYRRCVEMCEAVYDLPGQGVFQHVSDFLDLDLDVTGVENIPKEGSFLLTPNHPTGMCDAMAVFRILMERRPDHMLFGNRDAYKVGPKLRDYIIPVEWVKGGGRRRVSGSRETLKASLTAFRRNMGIVLFPAGRISYRYKGGLKEQPWLNTAISFQRKFDAPIIPVHITAKNSWLYYLFWRISPELRDMTVFHELLNKRRQTFRIVIGKPLTPADIPEEDEARATWMVQHYVERDLKRGVDWADRSPTPDALPVEVR